MIRFPMVVFSFALMTGCAGPATHLAAPAEPPLPSLPVNWAEVEDFDPAPYTEPNPSANWESIHRVPAQLMQGIVGVHAGGADQDGFRIQVHSTQEMIESDRFVAEVVNWWQSMREEGELSDDGSAAPVYQDFRAPYYRIRLGNFLTRENADGLLKLVEQRYPNAFIVPSRVRVE